MPLDLFISDFFFSIRDPFLLKAFSVITILGNWEFALVLTICLSLLLVFLEKHKFVLPFWISVAGSILFTTLSKMAFQIERPLNAFLSLDSFSFPSGHATIAVALYGFLVYLLIRSTYPSWIRRFGLILFLIIILLIGLSRLYLGVHYFSDIYVGFLVGLLWLMFGVILSEWQIMHYPGKAKSSDTIN